MFCCAIEHEISFENLPCVKTQFLPLFPQQTVLFCSVSLSVPFATFNDLNLILSDNRFKPNRGSLINDLSQKFHLIRELKAQNEDCHNFIILLWVL